MIGKDVIIFLKSIVAHDGIYQVQYYSETPPGTRELFKFGLVTRVVVTDDNSQIRTKAQWFNRRKVTNDFVKELRKKCIDASRSDPYSRSEFIALTPVGVRFVKNMNIS